MIGNSEVAGIIVALVAVVIAATDKRLLRRLREQGADSSEQAARLGNVRGLARWRLARLHQKGMVQRVRENAYFIDESILHAARAARRKRAFIVLCVLASAGLVYLVLRYVAA